jgi:signal transduction histidine kinase
MIRDYLGAELAGSGLGPVRVRLTPPPPSGTAVRPALAILTGTPYRRLEMAVRLGDGSWLTVDGILSRPPALWSAASALSMLLMMTAVVLLGILLVRRLTRPLSLFAGAAERLGRDVAAPPLPETGPEEVRLAARAFNTMQERLRRLVERRTVMLAAISHDLRTPITYLRLRAELGEDTEDRAKVLATLDQMEGMIASTLAFARDDSITEARQPVDLVALLDTICADLADTGADVALDRAPDRLVYLCAPASLRRALGNLIENAVKYGRTARVSLTESGTGIVIDIADDGPGIPPDRMAEVFAPFARLDAARNVSAGGVGLGLAIAQAAIIAHGGEIVLENRPEGGLRASVRLPR